MTADEVWDRVHSYALARLADQQPVYTNDKGVRNFIADVKPGSIGRRSDEGTTNSSRVTRSHVEKVWTELNGGPRHPSVLYFTYALIAAAMPEVVEKTADGLVLRKVPVEVSPEQFVEGGPTPAQDRKRQGFVVDPVLRKALEKYGMTRAAQHFRKLGYDVDDSVHTHNPFDLRCTLENEVLHVEVKATTTLGEAILLTRGEVAFARKNKETMVLFVVHSIVVTRAADDIILSGGQNAITSPWDVDAGILVPMTYSWAKEPA